MKQEEFKRMYELLKGHNFVFLDDNFIDAGDIEDEIRYWRDSYMCEDDEEIIVPVYKAKPANKPSLDFDDIGDFLDNRDYNYDGVWGLDIIDKNQETLDKINELFHSLIDPIYFSSDELFDVIIYADEEKGFEIEEINKGEN